MDATDQATDQIVRMTLAGSETLVRLTGAATKNVAAALIAAISSKERTKGKTRLVNLLKSDKELKVFELKQPDLEKFALEAKRYGVLYSLIKPKSKDAPVLDILVKAVDASKLNRILENLGYAQVKPQKQEAQNNKHETSNEVISKDANPKHEQTNMDALAEILGAPNEQDASNKPVPLEGQVTTKAQSEPLLVNSSSLDEATRKTPRRSVRRDLEQLRTKRSTQYPRTASQSRGKKATLTPHSKNVRLRKQGRKER